MKIRKSKIQNLRTIMLMVVGALVWILSCGNVATAFDFHADSAHGNTGYGVNRSGTECPPGTPCPTGACAHCHDTFDDSICGENPLMLFYEEYISKSDMLCFQCHRTVDLGPGVVGNEPYCVNFGGRSSITGYTSVKKEFTNNNSKPAACGSRHNLNRVQFIIKDNKNEWGFNSNPIPCLACHPSHAAQRSHPVADVSGGGKLNTAIRRVIHYKSTDPAYLLWGDDVGERMSDYATSNGATYQAPYYGDTSRAKFEPSGNASPSDGSDLPDYVTFCLDCHKDEQKDPDNGSRTVKAIDWSAEIHGAAPSNPGYYVEGFVKSSSFRPPYVSGGGPNYILSCLDCHEPHGTSRRLHLIRRMINGQLVAAQSTVDPLEEACDQPTDWAEICEKCHLISDPADHLSWGGCTSCHVADPIGGWHGGTFPFWAPDYPPSF